VTGAKITAYVDQYLAAVNYLDQTWPFNRGLAGDEVIAYAVRRALLGDPWESKENGHGYLLVPSLGTRTELNPGITGFRRPPGVCSRRDHRAAPGVL